MRPPRSSRYRAVSRRSFLRTSLAAGALAAVPGLACGRSDSEVLAGAIDLSDPSTTPSTAAPSTAAPSTAPPTTAPTTQAPDTTTSAATTSTAVAGFEMLIDFTYTAAESGRRVRNPYVAVWIEDAAENLVATVAVYYLQSNKGMRWINDLRRWFRVDGSDAALATLSSATRAPGSYSLTWSGVGADGQPVAPGDYYICIEAAREHGPYSLIREPVTLDGSSVSLTLPDNEELNSARVVVAA